MILDENTMAMMTPNDLSALYCMRYDKLAIDGDNLAKDDPCIACQLWCTAWRHNVRDQVFGSNPRCSHTTTQDGRTGHKDTPTTAHQPYPLPFHRPTRHAAPDTLRPIQRPTPMSAHAYGDDCARKLPTLNASPCPFAVRCMSSRMIWGGGGHAPVKRR